MGAGDDGWLSPSGLRRTTGVAITLLAGCWLAGWAVSELHSSPGIGLDEAARTLGSTRVPVLDELAAFLAAIGGEPLSILIAVAVGVTVLLWRGLAPALAFVLASLVSSGQVILMKWVVARPGPAVHFFQGVGSFPSGHVANAAVMAVFGGLLVRRGWAWGLGAAYVLVMAVSRVVTGAHWATDAIAGGAEGASVALLVWSLASEIARRSERGGSSDGSSPPGRP
jgi:membrane-associated phospholipid phosphatase